jgi:hypothetical protein
LTFVFYFFSTQFSVSLIGFWKGKQDNKWKRRGSGEKEKKKKQMRKRKERIGKEIEEHGERNDSGNENRTLGLSSKDFISSPSLNISFIKMSKGTNLEFARLQSKGRKEKIFAFLGAERSEEEEEMVEMKNE